MKNMAASVKARLLNLAKSQNIEYNRIQLLYAQERFLARLAISSHRQHFILKGGLFLYSHYRQLARPTRDMDFLGQATSNDITVVQKKFQEIAQIFLDDGMIFNSDTVTTRAITEEKKYTGVRVEVQSFLGSSKQALLIDIGFGDALTHAPVELEFPTLLDFTAPQLLAYSMATVLAEKFEAMVSLGEANSRYKDFYDLWRIASSEKLEANALLIALQATFEHRGTDLSKAQEVFLEVATIRQQQWKLFRQKTDATAPETLTQVLEVIRGLLEPLLLGQIQGTWQPEQQSWR